MQVFVYTYREPSHYECLIGGQSSLELADELMIHLLVRNIHHFL